jgi:hypothetical protein
MRGLGNRYGERLPAHCPPSEAAGVWALYLPAMSHRTGSGSGRGSARGRETAKRGGALIDGRAAGSCGSNLRLGTQPDRLLKQPESTLSCPSRLALRKRSLAGRDGCARTDHSGSKLRTRPFDRSGRSRGEQ